MAASSGLLELAAHLQVPPQQTAGGTRRRWQKSGQLVPVPFAAKFPRIPIDGIVVADHVPETRPRPCHYVSVRLQAGLLPGLFSPMQAGRAANRRRPSCRIAGRVHARPRPLLPRADSPTGVRRGHRPGHLSVASPYACYLERDLRAVGTVGT